MQKATALPGAARQEQKEEEIAMGGLVTFPYRDLRKIASELTRQQLVAASPGGLSANGVVVVYRLEHPWKKELEGPSARLLRVLMPLLPDQPAQLQLRGSCPFSLEGSTADDASTGWFQVCPGVFAWDLVYEFRRLSGSLWAADLSLCDQDRELLGIAKPSPAARARMPVADPDPQPPPGAVGIPVPEQGGAYARPRGTWAIERQGLNRYRLHVLQSHGGGTASSHRGFDPAAAILRRHTDRVADDDDSDVSRSIVTPR